MAKFTVYGVATVGVFKVVEAKSEKEAIAIAEGLGTPSLCHQCSSAGGGHSDTWQMSDGLGDIVEDITAEKG